ncbi:hypothetical protein FQN50_008657 [Emmonsiellopsis sp. PD_5]|nr:hypothetical protein FQN50_008657 [Emmonsiellopsis sp. PD_5]
MNGVSTPPRRCLVCAVFSCFPILYPVGYGLWLIDALISAGVTDSALTNHGVLQIQRLAVHFKAQGVEFTNIFSSDLVRARTTAEGICGLHGEDAASTVLRPVLLPVLREKNFGPLEGKSWLAEATYLTQGEQESQAAVAARVDLFLREHLLPVLHDAGSTAKVVAVVSHGVFLSAIWDGLSRLFLSKNINLGPDVPVNRRIALWSNTGYLEVVVERIGDASVPVATSDAPNDPEAVANTLHGHTMTVLTVNGKHHLRNLTRTPGVGSAKHDPNQRRLDSFFQKN